MIGPEITQINRYGVPQLIELRAHVLHDIDLVSFPVPDCTYILGASDLGVTRMSVTAFAGAPMYLRQDLVSGAPGKSPETGCRKVRAGRLHDGRRFLATLEPGHGTEVVVYLSESLKPLKFGRRHVIEASLEDGRALCVADVDGDGDDEVFAGGRGAGTSVLAFDLDGKTWVRSVVDDRIAAEDLRGGDLDGDGIADIVAVGGSTHNIIWYRPRPRPVGK